MAANWPTPAELQEARRQAIALSPQQREAMISRWKTKKKAKNLAALERIVKDEQIERATSVLLEQSRI